MLMVAALPPADTGLKATVSVQLALAPRLPPQPFVSTKSSAWPVSVMELNVRLAVPLLVTVTDWVADGNQATSGRTGVR